MLLFVPAFDEYVVMKIINMNKDRCRFGISI